MIRKCRPRIEVIGIQRFEARAAVANGRGNGALRKIGAGFFLCVVAFAISAYAQQKIDSAQSAFSEIGWIDPSGYAQTVGGTAMYRATEKIKNKMALIAA